MRLSASSRPLAYKWLYSSFLWCLLVFSGFYAVAQNPKPDCSTDCSCDMAGKIVDQQSKLPLPYATVQVAGTSIGTIADDKGIFHLHNLCAQEFDLVVSFVGYKSISHHHDLYHSDPVIYLSPDDTQLQSIVVEGIRPEDGMISTTVSTLGATGLEETRGQRLGEVLQQISGVSSLSTGQNIQKPVVHGLHSNRILLINNGIRHESQGWGEAHAPEIDPSQAGAIRLIKGAAAVKYGPGALGGVILIDPVQPQLTTPLRGNASLNLKSNGRATGASALLQQGSSSLAWIAQASGQLQGDLHAPDYVLSNTGARELGFAAGALYHKGQLDLKLHYSYFQQKLGILRGSVVGSVRDLALAMSSETPAHTSNFTYTINTPHQQTNHHLVTLHSNWNLGNSQFSVQYGFQANNRQEYDVRRGTNNLTPSINLDLFTHSLEADWKHPGWGRFSGTAGLQAQYQDNNNIAGTNTTPFLPNFNTLSLGAYLAESITWGKSIIDAGLRYDYMQADARGRTTEQVVFVNELNYHSFTASTGIYRPIGRNASLQSNLGLAWRPPNMAELYSYGKHEWIVAYGLWRFYQGESGLITQAEKPANSELGYKWVNTYAYADAGLEVEFSGYLNFIQHYIYTRPIGLTTTARGALPYFAYDQTNAFLAGLDGSANWEHNQTWASELRFSLLYAADVASNERFVGMPPNRIAYTLRLAHNHLGSFKNFSTGLEAAYSFRQFLAPRVISPQEILEAGSTDPTTFTPTESGFDFLEAPDGYLLFNFSSSIERGRFSYRLRVRNLLNTAYREYTNRLRYFANEPGRNFIFSVKYSF